MLSGLYDLTRLAHSDYERAYFGADAARFAGQSSLAALCESDVAMLFSVAALDPETFQTQAAYLVDAYVARHGRWPRMAVLDGQNHVSALYQLGLESDPLGPVLKDFIADVTGV